jgi:hypothetical protein
LQILIAAVTNRQNLKLDKKPWSDLAADDELSAPLNFTLEDAYIYQMS